MTAGQSEPFTLSGSEHLTPRSWEIILPPGLELLSMNGRENRYVRARKVKALKEATAWTVKAASLPRLNRIQVALYYEPPTRRRRDHDNLMATYKPVADGIVLAGVVADDDVSHVAPPHCEVTAAVHPLGRLRIVITDLGEPR